MIEKDPTTIEQFSIFFYKVVVPTFIAISMKLATQANKERITITKVCMSFVVGIGCAYFVSPFANGNWSSIIIGVVAMSGEKIAEYIIYKWDVDRFLSAILDIVIERIRPKK